MLHLRSNKKYNLIAELDHEIGLLNKIKLSEINSNSILSIDGFFDEYKNMYFAIYKYKGNIFFRCNPENLFPLNQNTIIETSGKKNKKLVVMEDGREVFTAIYSLDESNFLKDDITPFTDKEDFDFGLFISNISKNEERKKVFLSDS